MIQFTVCPRIYRRQNALAPGVRPARCGVMIGDSGHHIDLLAGPYAVSRCAKPDAIVVTSR